MFTYYTAIWFRNLYLNECDHQHPFGLAEYSVKIYVSAHSNCVSSDISVCVYISSVWTCTREKYPVSMHLCLGCRLGLQRGADCWTTGMNGSRHLLSLVSQMERGYTIQSEQSRVTNEWDISAERRGLMDRKTHRWRKGSGKKKYKKVEKVHLTWSESLL